MSAGYRLPLDPSILLGSTPPPPTVAPHNGVESADATWGPERGRYPSLSCPVMMTRPFPTTSVDDRSKLLDSTMYSNDEFADWSSSQPLLPQEVSSSVSQPLLEDDSYHQSIYHAPDVYDHQSGNWRSIMPSTAIPATSHPGLVPDGGSHPPPLVLSPPTSSLAQYPCCWSDDPRCSGWVQGSNREMSEHLRSCHDFVGHEKDVVPCNWDGCGARMQRMNLARHIVSTHLRVRVRCRWCGRSFTRSDVTSRHEKECDENLKRFLIV
ncbi:hypothetical protein F5I97DRAFT_1827785 [Phlebopus sp. FC_14]|nr:hypothetical protein F5I97DRAFT_1827785 [Phlebopus sp. FC_14]